MLSAAIRKKSNSTRRNQEENRFLVIRSLVAGRYQEKLDGSSMTFPKDPGASIGFCPKTGPLLFSQDGTASYPYLTMFTSHAQECCLPDINKIRNPPVRKMGRSQRGSQTEASAVPLQIRLQE